MELFLSHNPYTIETIFMVDEKKCDAEWFKTLTTSNGTQSRLQMWIMHFFDKLHDAYPAKEKFYLTFKGTSADCDDIQKEAESAAARLGISITTQLVKCGDPEDKFERLQELYEEAQKGPYDGFKDIELADGFNKIADRKLSVSVMAPMKNGKSTLLNAILGQEILPNATQRCTAKISYIEHCAGATGFEAKKIDEKNNSSDYISCSQKILKEWNSDDAVRHVRIRGALPGINISDYRLQFIDTPGPDSAVHKEDLTTIERFLNDNSLPMVCYIIDRVNTSEVHYLERLKKHMSQYGKQSEDRFIFVVSRMDQLEISKSDSFEDNPIRTKIEEIRNDLKELGINNPRIFPVSAWIALKAREFHSMDEDDQDEAIDSFKKFRRGMRRIDSSLMDYMSISPAIKSRLMTELSTIVKKIDLDEETGDDHLRHAELLSGIPALEMAIEEYLIKYSVPARIYDAAAIFDDGIKKADAERALLGDITSKQTSLKEIENNISQLRDFLKKGEGAQALQTQMFPEKWQESPSLKRELSSEDRDFDIQIREKIADWTPQTLDKNGTITPEEAKKLVNDFISFMKTLSNTMLGVYATAVENDAKAQFNDLKIVYEEKIQIILGKMPPELRDFLNKFDFILRPTGSIKIDMESSIVETIEEYIRREQREITADKDGYLKAFISILPFTETTVWEDVTRTRKVKRVNLKTLKSCIKEEASNVRQANIKKAEETAALHYRKLREQMLGQFKLIDEKLRKFNADLQQKLSSEQSEKEKLEEYQKVLEWVKAFQERLMHVLDLEV